MEDKRPVNSAHTGNNSSDNHLCKRKRTNLEYSSNWHDNDTNGKCLFPAKAFALSWWTLVKFIQPGDTNIPKRKVEMAPKKLGGVSFLVTWGRFLMMIQTILCRTMTHNCSLEVRVRVAHGVEEILSDDDTTEDTLVITCIGRITQISLRLRTQWSNELTKERHCCGTSNSHPDVELSSSHAEIKLPFKLLFVFYCMMLGLFYALAIFLETHRNRQLPGAEIGRWYMWGEMAIVELFFCILYGKLEANISYDDWAPVRSVWYEWNFPRTPDCTSSAGWSVGGAENIVAKRLPKIHHPSSWNIDVRSSNLLNHELHRHHMGQLLFGQLPGSSDNDPVPECLNIRAHMWKNQDLRHNCMKGTWTNRHIFSERHKGLWESNCWHRWKLL